MNWINRNWFSCAMAAEITLALVYCFGVMLFDWPTAYSLTAHAQERDAGITFTIGAEIAGPWIEQHCVAVTSPARDIDWDKVNEEAKSSQTLPFYQRHGIEHVPEQTSRLRCK